LNSSETYGHKKQINSLLKSNEAFGRSIDDKNNLLIKVNYLEKLEGS
jgi:hypothetical protein